MNWSTLFAASAIAVGAYLAAEALGQGRGKRGKHLKYVGVALSLGAGLALLVALWQFGWVTSPPTWVAVLAAAALLWQGAVAARDMISDGEPDRQCRIAAAVLPLLLVLGGAWLQHNAVDIAKQGKDHVKEHVTSSRVR